MKILVRGTNWIGDAVMTIPALHELRRIFPEAKITLHTRSWAKGLFQDADFIDEIIAFDKSESSLADVFSQARVLKKKRFDAAILFPNSFASALTVRFAGIPKRFGYSKDGRRLFLSEPVTVPKWKSTRHEVYYYLNLVSEVERRMLGTDTVSQCEPQMSLNVSEKRRSRARGILAENGVDLSKRTVALGVGSANSRAKRWEPESYARLNDLLQRDLEANVILIGAKDELDVSFEVFKMTRSKPIVLTGKTNLDEATAILSEIDLLISNDMGPAHIAPAVGTDTIVIFGPTNPATTRPFSDKAEIIRKAVECSPCMLRDCPIDHRCMTRISVEEVFERAKEKLKHEENIASVGRHKY